MYAMYNFLNMFTNYVMLRFPKYMKTESQRESESYIREKNTPYTYAKPKIT